MIRGVSLPARWLRLDSGGRALLLEALFALLAARLAVLLLPFRRVARLASRRPNGPVREASAEEIARLRWAIRAVARRVPFRALCLEQGLAAQAMLRRRGIAATLHYGVGKPQGEAFLAHAWVRAGTQDVIGTEGCDRFAVLAVFPEP
ncbi:lasso peptide biosynthesis B2 protein [Ancylobacter lacus]|uniref:lasso peptide biosynthesis B2 protein n=1 Tax=Ancylobacter lacus TaxID=2579970 RepID=UPI001FEB5BA2|nr:lasso peptide biosynthesis B2 protein [Ancylobacter lacus]